MRDPNRIPQIEKLLGEAWRKSPDMRLSQLIMCAANLGGWTKDDIWHCEDDKITAGLVQIAHGEVK